jgi:1-acyl-sn-glycerol-3-phosphate acyltransferase
MISKLSYLRASYRLLLFIIGTLILLPFQILWVAPFSLTRSLMHHQSPVARLWFKYILWAFNIRVTLVNKRLLSRKQKIFLSNHISYVDILIMGAYFDGFFIAKSDIASWPIFGFFSKLTGTLFIVRNRRFLVEQIALLKKHLEEKQSLIIFPEGTTGNGHEIQHFKSGLLNAPMEMEKRPVLQPVSIRYTHINDKPLVTQEEYDNIAWYGDMVLAPHLWQLLRNKNVKARVTLHHSVTLQNDMNPKTIMAKIEAEVKSDFV